jgi:hypothetical protein
MSDITGIMAEPLTCCAHMEFEIIEVVNEVLDDENVVECETHTTGDSGNDGDDQRTAAHVDEQCIGIGGVSVKFVWQDILYL